MGAGNYVILLFFFFFFLKARERWLAVLTSIFASIVFFFSSFFPDAEFSQNGFNKKEDIEGPFFFYFARE